VTKVAVLGATGSVGQVFLQLLERHPWFTVAAVAASDRSAGQTYKEAVTWHSPAKIPEAVAELVVAPIEPKAIDDVDLVFSALPADVAKKTEESFAKAGYCVVSNASAHRLDRDVPLLNPEVNSDHIRLVEQQQRQRKWSGALITNPNCSTTILTLSLKPIQDTWGIKRVLVSTMQALSGAGYPGVASLDILDNVIPFIPNEEEKVEIETVKILGTPEKPADFKISASCHRVATSDGHLEAVFVETERSADPESVQTAMGNFVGDPQRLRLPSAPPKPLVVKPDENRPQTKLDRMEGNGMAVTVGRVRSEAALDGVKYIAVGHNTIRGAAGCAILNAEYLRAMNYLDR
jgi:aspartate-semialdehyde dehydrogenase